MGVMGSWCQLCGIQVQQDHYIPHEGRFYIYRGVPEEGIRPVVEFGLEHDWLKDAVALRLSENEEPLLLEGEVQDGAIGGDEGEGDGPR